MEASEVGAGWWRGARRDFLRPTHQFLITHSSLVAREYLFRVDVDPDRIVVTLGASGAMILAIVGCFDERQRLGLPQPFYYGYRHAMETLGVECVRFPTTMENNFQPTIADLEAIEGGIDGLVIASPNNPTGSMIRPEALQELAEYCENRTVLLPHELVQ